jgi:hypothetical protein
MRTRPQLYVASRTSYSDNLLMPSIEWVEVIRLVVTGSEHECTKWPRRITPKAALPDGPNSGMLEVVQMTHTSEENMKKDGLKTEPRERRNSENAFRPVSKYDDDIQKAIAGFCAASAMLTARETKASLQME